MKHFTVLLVAAVGQLWGGGQHRLIHNLYLCMINKPEGQNSFSKSISQTYHIDDAAWVRTTLTGLVIRNAKPGSDTHLRHNTRPKVLAYNSLFQAILLS